ncbi:MAG: ATP-dependent sacrificial sulfur transferase LarE [Planctomycetia bacterium]|nr:ATP-dependent sacrificial sulfur transferase LarE [Planctomycetia bacterium]
MTDLIVKSMDDALLAKREQLLALVAGYRRCAVAYSGGVDSAVVCQAAFLALGDEAVAVTANSESLASGELEAAQEVARQIGIRHVVMRTNELANPLYVRNAPDRCYHCKAELYQELEAFVEDWPGAVMANGANADDQGDYRPGMTAAAERQVRSPLLECGINKQEVRQLAEAWGLPVWDKPASPCLSSRLAYGEEVTPDRLRAIDLAEQKLRGLGLLQVRVRYHRGDLARIEVPAEAIARLADPSVRDSLVSELRLLGFKYVTLDLAGFASGSMNAVLPVESLVLHRA